MKQKSIAQSVTFEKHDPIGRAIKTRVRVPREKIPELKERRFKRVNTIVSKSYTEDRPPTKEEVTTLRQLLFRSNDPEILDETIATVVEGFRHVSDKDGNIPARMARGDHYLVNHSLHVASIIQTVIPAANREVLVAALLHDYCEDVPGPHQDLAVLERAGREDNTFDSQLVKDAVDRLTIKQGETYFAGVERLIEEPHDESASIALLVKLADKMSAAQNISPFTIEKQLRIGGAKIWKVVNLARIYVERSSNKVPLQDEIATMTTQAAAAWERAMGWAAHQITRNLHLLYDVREKDLSLRSKRGAATRKVNKYIRSGGLERLEQESQRGKEGLAGTIYHTMLLGLPLDSKKYTPPRHFWREGEDGNTARERMRRERDVYRQELPLLPLKHRFTNLSWPYFQDVEEQKRRFPDCERERAAYQNALLTFTILQALARVYLLDDHFRLPNL